MKTIKKDDLYRSLGDFLKTKGIEFKDGVYTNRINRACGLLTDAINETQKTVKRAKVKVDQKLNDLRQTIHDATAPNPPPAPPPPKSSGGKSGKKPERPKARPSARRK